MIFFSLIIALIAICYKAESVSLCDSKLCVCKVNKSDQNDFGETIDCSYYPLVLETDYELPSTVYSLDLSWNNLTYINSSRMFHSNTLTALLLNYNKISEIGSNGLQLPNLKRLDLSYNNLEFINKETFKYINKLEYLNLANNRFRTLSALSFHHLADLSEIILDNNHLGPSLRNKNLFDRSGYGLTHKIKSLSMSGIDLNVVHDNFFVDAYDIRKLVISNNNISEVFELPNTLEYLDLSNNPIMNIFEEDFADVPALKELVINNLSISEIHEYTFAYLPGLVNLQLERNIKLTNFNELAFGRDVLEDADDFTLEKLSLKGSRLTTLSNKLIVPFSQLNHLDLQGNFWNCDCNLNWIKTLQISESMTGHLRCYTPRTLCNSKIMELNEKYFICPINKHINGAIIGLISTCVLLTFIAIWIFVVVPRNQSRNNFIKNMFSSSTAYSLLPVHLRP